MTNEWYIIVELSINLSNSSTYDLLNLLSFSPYIWISIFVNSFDKRHNFLKKRIGIFSCAILPIIDIRILLSEYLDKIFLLVISVPNVT